MANEIKNINHSTIYKLNEIIKSNSGEIVSKTLTKTDGVSISLFAFQKDESLSEHSVPGDALIYVIEGKCDFTIDGKKQSVSTGEVIVLPGNIPHALKAVTDFKMLLIITK